MFFILPPTGIRFTQWYSAESVCTPSRMAWMTGRMPTRFGMQHTVFSPHRSDALPLDERTLAEALKAKGYVTGMAGKWHLGINNLTSTDGAHLPAYRGFDEVGHILPFSNHWLCDESGRHLPKPGVDHKSDLSRDQVCFLYRNTTIVQQPIDHQYLTATLVGDAIGFIQKRAALRDQREVTAETASPFFYYLAFPQCHVSMFTNTNFTNTSANGIFGDQIREMDWAIGQVLDSLDQNGFRNNTIVVFSSDHGPHVELCAEGGSAGWLRGGKGDSSWEGGLRVPGIISWPGVIQAGRVNHAPVSSMDVFATIADLAGVDIDPHRPLDGVSLAPLFSSENSDKKSKAIDLWSSPHEALFHYW